MIRGEDIKFCIKLGYYLSLYLYVYVYGMNYSINLSTNLCMYIYLVCKNAQIHKCIHTACPLILAWSLSAAREVSIVFYSGREREERGGGGCKILNILAENWRKLNFS